MLRAIIGSALVLATGTLGCDADPEDAFRITGQVVTGGGTPVADRPISFSLIPRDGACYLPPVHQRPAVEPIAQSLTAVDGRFEFLLYRFQEYTECAYFVVEGASTGSTELVIDSPTSHVELPPLTIWEGELAASIDGGAVRLVAPEIPWTRLLTRSEENGPPEGTGHLNWNFAAAGGAPFWSQRTATRDIEVLPYWLDGSDSVEVQPEVVSEGMVSGEMLVLTGASQFLYVQRTRVPAAPLLLSAPVPVSRGATCRIGDELLAPCPLTDGSMDPVELGDRPAPGSLHAEVELFRLELPRLSAVETVIVRRLEQEAWWELRVEGSVDGEVWVPLADAPQDATSSLRRGLARNVRHVQLDVREDAPAIQQLRILARRQTQSPSTLAEVSVFERPE